MEPNNQFNQDMNSAPLGANNPVSAPMESNKKIGPIVVILSIVLVLIIGALYLFASGMNKNPQTDTEVPETVQPVTNTSDDVQAIDADLNAAIEGIDAQTF